MRETQTGVGGWQVPCVPFDYRGWEAGALAQQEAIRARLDRLKAERPRRGEQELIRRREIRMLTDMYYEQRSNARMFAALARWRQGV